MSPNKCLLILLDGLGDRQYPELGQLTPLQAAHTPNLDFLAHMGGNGLYHAGSLGEPLPSENAHFSIFGYPRSWFPGRGPLEALGAGIDLKTKEVAVLTHFVSAEKRQGQLFVLQDRPEHGDDQDARHLFELVDRFEQQGIRVELKQTKGLFGVIVLRGEVSPLITDSSPMRDQAWAGNILPTAEGKSDPVAHNCARVLRTYLVWTYNRLHQAEVNIRRQQKGLPPINALVTQRTGCLRNIPSFVQRTGLKGACVASGPLYQGLGKLMGLKVQDISEHKEAEADFSARLELAGKLLSEYDFVHVHTKAPDTAAHSKNCQVKTEVISSLDHALGPFMDVLAHDPNILTVIASDHSTPSSGPMIHSGEPVPVIMHGKNIRQDRVRVYDEITAASGALGMIREMELMLLMLNAMDMARMRGIRESVDERLYWPGANPGLPLDS